jgi:hypothetical protein
MCYCVFLASDHPFPIIPLVQQQPAFNAEPLQDEHPVKKWLNKGHQVQLGSRTWCACGLNFQLNEWFEGNAAPMFSTDLTPEMWAVEAEEYRLTKKCMEDYFAYMRAMLALGDLEWYCCWDGNWDAPPVCRLQMPASVLVGEPNLQKAYPLEEGLYIHYEAAP